ncbi:MAG: hypothetical protein U1E92_03955 [Moraxella osloensis]
MTKSITNILVMQPPQRRQQAAWQLRSSEVPQRPRRLWQVPANNLTKRLGSVKNWVKSHSVFCFFDGF